MPKALPKKVCVLLILVSFLLFSEIFFLFGVLILVEMIVGALRGSDYSWDFHPQADDLVYLPFLGRFIRKLHTKALEQAKIQQEARKQEQEKQQQAKEELLKTTPPPKQGFLGVVGVFSFFFSEPSFHCVLLLGLFSSGPRSFKARPNHELNATQAHHNQPVPVQSLSGNCALFSFVERNRANAFASLLDQRRQVEGALLEEGKC
jgi:hypothetical protein